MPLTTGTRLGPYEIVAALGAGGMGEVYRARDTSLNRDVALKILPENFAADPDRLSRFTREAQALAALNHTNIAHVYGLERPDRDAAAKAFIVMELVEGDDLAQRIARGPIPIDQAIPIARQIAEGLEAAHEHGIVHRDLKPANVKVRSDATVKILDFGLAKAIEQGPGTRDQGSGHYTNSPTFTSPAMTAAGMILGTAAYMSPEQARGGNADPRSDIWSFGCVLFEMLTGRTVFAGPTVSDTLAAILRGAPDWNLLPPDTPPAVRHLLERCLVKDHRRRLAAASEIIVALDPALAMQAPAPPSADEAWYQHPGVWMTVISAIAIGTALGWIMRGGQRSAEPPPPAIVRLEAGLGDAAQLSAPPRFTQMTIAPDGQSIVFSGQSASGQRSLYLRRLDRGDVRQVPGTTGGESPFFSPDGAWIGFWSNNTLMKVPADGGTAITICRTDVNRQPGPSPVGWISQELFSGASWGDDGKIVFAGFNSSLWEVSSNGGAPQPLTTLSNEGGEFAHRAPHVLPGSTAVLFSIVKNPIGSIADIAIQSKAGGQPRVVIQNGFSARFVEPGFIVFAREGTIFAARFDPTRAEVVGVPVPVQEHVQQAWGSSSPGLNLGASQFAVSRTGTLVYGPGRPFQMGSSRLVWAFADGKIEEWGDPKPAYLSPRLSPDERLVAFMEGGFIHTFDLERGGTTRISSVSAAFPVWMPDGRSVVAMSPVNGPQNLYRFPIDASTAPEQLTRGPRPHWASSVSRDGTRLLYVQTELKTGNDIWMVPLTGDRTPQLLVQTPGDDGFPSFAPDGKWLLYASNESGRYEVYIRPLAGGGRTKVSPNGGLSPIWSKDGAAVFYWDNDTPTGQLWRVEVHLSGEPKMGAARLLPIPRLGGTTPVGDYDVSRDGKRFVGTTRRVATIDPITSLNVVINWTRDLDARVPKH